MLVGGMGVDVEVGDAIGDACGEGVMVAVGIGEGRIVCGALLGSG